MDGILVGAITQYHPYPPPRIGMTLQLISPYEAVVVASVDGLWDARRKVVADDARAFYESNSYHWQFAQETDVGLSSPLLYQRYVCSRAVHELFTLPPPPQPVTAPEGKGQTAKADEPSPAKQGLNAKETNMTPSAKAKEEVPPPSAAGPPIDVETLPPPMAVPPESVQLTSGQR